VINQKEITELTGCEVDVFPQTLYNVSHDASIFEVKPEAFVHPKDIASLCKLVQYVSTHSDESGHGDIGFGRNGGMNITARSAGTDMGGGPLGQSIIVDFTKYFNHIKEVGDGYAVVEPGVYYRDFDKETLAHGGQILPSYPASRELCTVGGMTANNSGGEKTLTYGKTEKYIRRLKMVLADGKEYEFKPLTLMELEQQKGMPNLQSDIYHKMYELITTNRDILEKARPEVSKNSCGYYLWNVMYDRPILNGEKSVNTEKVFDLTKMIVGSQGTLGLVTEVEFGLVKPNPHSRLLVVFLKDMKSLGRVASEIMKFKPESFESYDDHTFRVAVKFLPSLIKQLKGNVFRLAIGFLPELWAVIRGGVPKMVLMAEFTATTAGGALYEAMQAEKALAELSEAGVFSHKIRTEVTRSASATDKYWVIRRESFNMLRKHSGKLRTAPFIDDFVVKPEHLSEFLPQLYDILDQYRLTYTIAGHVGDGNFHIIPLMDLREPKAHKIIEDLSVRVYKLVHKFGGSITGEHNDGIIRTPFVKMQYGEEVYALFEQTKKIWDPKGIFNPGKKVGGTLEYAFEHIVNS